MGNNFSRPGTGQQPDSVMLDTPGSRADCPTPLLSIKAALRVAHFFESRTTFQLTGLDWIINRGGMPVLINIVNDKQTSFHFQKKKNPRCNLVAMLLSVVRCVASLPVDLKVVTAPLMRIFLKCYFPRRHDKASP
jgi:hypothetical protein